MKPEPIFVTHTDNTPEVLYDVRTHVLAFTGSCFPSNSIDFFEPILKWVDDYTPLFPKEPLKLLVAINYMNTSANKQLFILVSKLKQKIEAGFFPRLDVVWVYELHDEDTEMGGRDIERLGGVSVTLICLNKQLI
ncbi:MAG: DUF1987 domain-containing protein [Bacteroidetes bacterium]|nr:DUF1987 domain-containing protein [Bacteroidota bacterium]